MWDGGITTLWEPGPVVEENCAGDSGDLRGDRCRRVRRSVSRRETRCPFADGGTSRISRLERFALVNRPLSRHKRECWEETGLRVEIETLLDEHVFG